MTGLRDKLKKRRRETILSAAESLFKQNGYGNTKIEDIADKAEVSVGTLYTYFGSKGGVMYELTLPLHDSLQERGNAVLAKSFDTAEQAIIELYIAYQFDEDWKSRNYLKAYDPTHQTTDKRLLEAIHMIEDLMKRQCLQMLQNLVAEGKFNRSLDLEHVVFILHTLLITHFGDFLEDKYDSYEACMEQLQLRQRTVFANWSESDINT